MPKSLVPVLLGLPMPANQLAPADKKQKKKTVTSHEKVSEINDSGHFPVYNDLKTTKYKHTLKTY